MIEFKAVMEQFGLIPGDIEPGKLCRCGTQNKPNSKNGWYRYFDDDPASGVYGDWSRDDVSHSWRSSRNGGTFSEQDRALFSERLRQAEQEKQAKQQEAGQRVNEHFETLPKADSSHAYLIKKGVPVCGDVRQNKGCLVIPIKKSGKIISTQTITSDGSKKFAKDCSVRGGNFFIPGTGDPILCEGYATGATIHMVTNRPVIVAFSAGNLKEVGLSFRKKHPDKKILITADNDHKTEGNPGLSKANEVAKLINAEIVCPNGISGSDFNDVLLERGADEVKAQLKLVHGNEKPVFVTAEDVYVHEIPDDWLITDVLQKGDPMFIVGAGGVGKSLLNLERALFFASQPNLIGRKLWNTFDVPKHRTTLFIQTENSRRTTFQRLRKQCAGIPEYLSGLPFLFFPLLHDEIILSGRFVDPNFQKLLLNLIKQIEDTSSIKIDCIDFDPLISFVDCDENDNAGMRRNLDTIGEFCRQASVSCFITHHYGKDQKVRGASAISDWPRNVITLDRIQSPNNLIEVKNPKYNNTRKFESFCLSLDENLIFQIVDDTFSIRPKAQERCKLVTRALYELGGRTANQSALIDRYMALSMVKESASKKHIQEAIQYGLIHRIENRNSGDSRQPYEYVLPENMSQA